MDNTGMDSSLTEETVDDGARSPQPGDTNKATLSLLKIVPSDGLCVNLFADNHLSEGEITMTNQSSRSVWYKVLVKTTSGLGNVRPLGASPDGGILRTMQSQVVRVAAAGHNDSNHDPILGSSVNCKLLIQAKCAKDGLEIDAYFKGDRTSAWDCDNDLRLTEEYEVDVRVVFPARKVLAPKAVGNHKSVSIEEDIQDLVFDHDQMRKDLSELEQRHQDNVNALMEARREDFEMASRLRWRRVKQLEELKSAKDELEQQEAAARMQDVEMSEQLEESDLLLQTLTLETEYLSKENLHLRQQRQQNSEFLKTLQSRLNDVTSKCEILQDKLGPMSTPVPLNPLTRHVAVSYPVSLFQDSYDGLKTDVRMWRGNTSSSDLSMLDSSAKLALSETPSISDRPAADCQDSGMLFFLKTMTISLLGLIFLVAANILITDLTQ